MQPSAMQEYAGDERQDIAGIEADAQRPLGIAIARRNEPETMGDGFLRDRRQRRQQEESDRVRGNKAVGDERRKSIGTETLIGNIRAQP